MQKILHIFFNDSIMSIAFVKYTEIKYSNFSILGGDKMEQELLKKILKEVEKIGELSNKVDRLEKKIDKIDELEIKVNKIDELSAKVDKIDELVEKVDRLEKKIDKIDELEVKVNKIDELSAKVDKIDELSNKVDNLGKELKDFKKEVYQLFEKNTREIATVINQLSESISTKNHRDSEETKQRLEKNDKEHRIYEAQIAKLQLTTQYLEEKGKKLA
jgi:outer membrane murein-binding lipoprotein Lpp